MRLKSWLAAAAGAVVAAPAVAQSPYPTNFDVTASGSLTYKTTSCGGAIGAAVPGT